MAQFQQRCILFCGAPVVYMTAVPIRLLLAEDILKTDGLHPAMVAVLCSPVAALAVPPLAVFVAEAFRSQYGRGRRKMSPAWLPCLAFQMLLLLLSIGTLLFWPGFGSMPAVPLREHWRTLRSRDLAVAAPPVPAPKSALAPQERSAPAGKFLAPPPEPTTTTAMVGRGKISVVLPCAMEGNYAIKTVQSFCDRTPDDVLQEIVVVDDGSKPPMEQVMKDIPKRCRLRVLRHETTMGLMVAKQTGGDAALGEFIGFFDCHVAPNMGWHTEILEKLQARPRRLVVPTITDLDLDTWDEKHGSASNSKCYISWDAEFMWFEDASDFIPVVSGGLVTLSRDWWQTSGGFDKGMRGWGGENVDQSLRTWLCGGEIVRAKSSRVAHMWRVPQDSRTTAHYRAVQGTDNNARVAAAWLDDFREKFQGGRLRHNSPDVTDVLRLKEALQCKPFAFFLHRFRRVYHNGGMLPQEVFKLRAQGSQKCMMRAGDSFRLRPCSMVGITEFHLGNQDPTQGGACCSGIRLWNTMQCLDRLDPTGPLPYFCDVTGHNANQQYHMLADGRIHHGSGRCVSTSPDGSRVAVADCQSATRWEREGAFRPQETTLYEEARLKYKFSDDDPDN